MKDLIKTFLDLDFYKRVLNRASSRIIEDLDSVSLLDKFVEKEFLPAIQVRDVQVNEHFYLRRTSMRGTKLFTEVFVKQNVVHTAV